MKEKKVRKLAAVMFADIVGYTALMEGDEGVATKIRTRHREVFQQQHALHHGEIIQYYGDGALSIFKSAIEAVNCAIEIQRFLKEGDPVVPLRVGIHMGDIVYSNTEVYGDGVNFASRIESMGVAGAIFLSGKLNDELKNHKHISTQSLGNFEFKNISNPVEVFSVTNEGITVPSPSDLKGKFKKPIKSIAVLPFVNMSSSVDNEYFSDGMTEEIINALAKIKELKVTSRTSSFFFKNRNIPIPEIGSELKVSTILEGSIRLAGKQMRITAQLIDVADDFHFWSETWDRELDHIFDIQDEISLIIADKLREHFGHFEIQEQLVEKQTDNLGAYEYSLKAKYFRNKWNPEDIKTAIALYEKALELDPDHDESHLGLADCYSFMGTTGFMPFEEAWGKTIKYTNQALELNSRSSGVHYQLSNQAFFIECDYGKSLREMQKAIELNPNNAEAQQFLSFLYIIAGEREKSLDHLEIAHSLNPLSDETHFFRAYYHYMTEDYTRSLELLDICLSANDKNIPAHSIKPLCLLKLGRFDEVISYFDSIPDDVVIEGEKTGALGLAYSLKKDRENTSRYLEKLTSQAKEPNGYTADSYLFLMSAVSGEKDKAFEWVAEAIAKKSSLLLLRYTDPVVASIRSDPRYEALKLSIYRTDAADEPIKPKTALLDENTTSEYSSRLMAHISDNKPYLNPDLSLRDLANQIDIHPNHLSWILNNSIGKNFNEFINQYRIEAFKSNAKAHENKNLTIEGLAYESGFNSKTVFNTYFKRETGLTPRQFLKQ